MKIKKILTATALAGSLIIGNSCAQVVTKNPEIQQEEAKVKELQAADGFLENIELTEYDHKGFKFDATISFYDGFLKLNEFEVEYEIETDQEGNYTTEKLEVDNHKFAESRKSRIGLEIVGGLIEKERYGLEIGHEKNDKYFQYQEGGSYGREFTEREMSWGMDYDGDDTYYSKKYSKDEIKEKVDLGKKKYDLLNKILDIDKKKQDIKGTSRYQLIKDYDISDFTNDNLEEANEYTDFYKWKKDKFDAKFIERNYYANLTIYNRDNDISVEYEFDEDGKTTKITIIPGRYAWNGKTEIEQDKYIKSLYTQAEIDEIFALGDKYYEFFKELIKTIPEEDIITEPEHRWDWY